MQVNKILYRSIVWRGLFFVSSFVLNIFIARHFEAANTGIFYYLINIYALIQLLTSLSLESAITYFQATKEIDTRRLIFVALIWPLLALVIILPFLYYYSDEIYGGSNNTLMFISGVGFLIGSMLYNFFAGLLYAEKNFIMPSLIGLIANIILVLLIPWNGKALIIGITDQNYFVLYFTSFIIQGAIIAIAFMLMSKTGFRIKIPNRKILGLLLRYSLMAWACNITFFLLYRIDYWFVERYCSAIDLGNYIQVSKLGQLFFLLPSIIATAIFPLTASGGREKIYRSLALVSRLFLFGYSLVCLALALTGYWLFPFIFGPTFNLMYIAFLLLIPGILSLSTLYTLTAYNSGKNKMKLNLVGSFIALIVVIVANTLLVPKYGINAAAAVSSLGYIVYQVFLIAEFKKEYGTKPGDFFFFKINDISAFKNLMFKKGNYNGI